MSNRKITQLVPNTNPTLSDVFPIVNNNVTKKLSLEKLIEFIEPYFNNGVTITGGTYDNVSGVLSLINNTGGTVNISGFYNGNIKKWNENQLIEIAGNESIIISGDYVLIDTDLQILNANNTINISSLSFEEKGEVYVGGNAFFKDTTINNDGIMSIAGALILSGNTTITGTGIII
jgi:hypothetical protein